MKWTNGKKEKHTRKGRSKANTMTQTPDNFSEYQAGAEWEKPRNS